jgi:hypothetical protein
VAESKFLQRRQQQLEAEQKQKVLEELGGVLAPGPASGEEATPVRALPIGLSTEYHEATNSWMHRFSDVRSDDNGFYILHDDNPDAWRMTSGDLLQDVALNATPYWEVTANDRFRTKRVDLKPIGPNPFVTGVGAGGAKIHKEDLKVITGEYEEKRLARIMDIIDNRKYTRIGDIKYMLYGTVAVNFGPNGPQGGWYNAHDWNCRGARKRLSEKEIIIEDASILRRLGFLLSDTVADGLIDGHEWGSFIESEAGNFGDTEDPPIYDPFVYKQKTLAMVKKVWEGDEYRTEHWTKAIDYRISANLAFRSGNLEEMLSSPMRYDVERYFKGLKKYQTFATHEENLSNIGGAILMLKHWQPDVQARCVSRCIVHIESSDDASTKKCRDALLKFIKSGKGYWLVNEQLINWAKRPDVQDIEILLEATKLPDGVNRKYAYWGLASFHHPYLLKAAFTETNPEALSAITWDLVEKGYMPGRHVVDFMMNRLIKIMREGDIYNRMYARDGLVHITRLARKQDLDVDEAYEVIHEYDHQVKSNPDGEMSDLEWFDLSLRHMQKVVKAASGR